MDILDFPSWTTLSSYFARVAYTAFLLIASFLLVRETFKIWSAEPLALGELTYIDAGVVNKDSAKGLVPQIVDRRNALKDVVSRWVTNEREAASAAADTVPKIELTIQGTDFGSLLTSLQRWIVPVNALKVSVFKRDDFFSFSLDWPNEDRAFADKYAVNAFRNDVLVETKLGTSIGCRMLWLELAENSPSIAEIHPDVFCRWAEALSLFETGETGAADDSVTGAGRLVAVELPKGAFSRVTAAAVVRDQNNKRFLVLPDYAFNSDAPVGVWVADGLTGTVSQRIGAFNRKLSKHGIALVALDAATSASNRVMNDVLKSIGFVNIGDEVTLLSAVRSDARTAKVADIRLVGNSSRIVTDRHISRPGDGGAPVVDSDGNLVAMGYAANPKERGTATTAPSTKTAPSPSPSA